MGLGGVEGGHCLRTIKIEDGNLFELVDLFIELFTGKQMGNSNIILLGSTNQMSCTGGSGYVFDWLACAEKIVSCWPNVKVCPLVPIWTEPVSSKLIWKVQELFSHFSVTILAVFVIRGRFSQGSWLKPPLRRMSRPPNPSHTHCHFWQVCQVPQKSKVDPSLHARDAQPWRHS